MLNVIDTIIFDLDGTLINIEQRHYRCYNDIMLSKNFSPIPLQKYKDIKRTGIKSLELLALSEAETMYQYFLTTWTKYIEKREYLVFDFPQKQTIDILLELQNMGVRLVLVTLRKNIKNLHWQLKKIGILKFFSHIITPSLSTDIDKHDLVKQQLKKIDTNKILRIGDTEADVQASHNLGIKICALYGGLRTRKFLNELQPTYLERDLCTFFKKFKKLDLFTSFQENGLFVTDMMEHYE